MKDKVSIIVPTYNQSEFLDETLESVRVQTYENWECIIINDGSEDNTEAIARNWVEKDKRFMYFFQENSGVSAARNHGISKANGDYILPLDSDDKIAKNYLEEAVKEFAIKNALKLVYCKARKFGEVNEDWRTVDFSLTDLAKGNMIFSSAMFKKSVWEMIGGYDENMKHGYEDYDFWISLLKDGGEVYQIPHTYFFYRIRKSSRNHSISDREFDEIYNYMSVKHAGFFVEHLGSFQFLLKEIKQLKDLNKRLKAGYGEIESNKLIRILRKLKFKSRQ